MTLQQCDASSREHVIDASNAVSAGSCKFISGSVEAGIKYFVVVSAEGLDALTSADIPKLAGSIDRSREAIVTGEVKLATGELTRVTFEGVDTLSCTNIPDLGRVIERTSK